MWALGPPLGKNFFSKNHNAYKTSLKYKNKYFTITFLPAMKNKLLNFSDMIKHELCLCSVLLCSGATFVKKNSCLVARIVSFDTVKSRNSIFLNWEFFSFNSYVYYLTRGFIASTRAFNLPTRAFNLVTRVFSILPRGFELVICGLRNNFFWEK